MNNQNPYTPPQAPIEAPTFRELFKQMPQQVKVAVGLQWLGLFLAVMAHLIIPTGVDEETNSAALMTMALSLVVTIYLTVKLYEGRNSVRYLMAGLTILSVLLLLAGGEGPGKTTVLQHIVNFLGVVFDCAALYLIFSQPGAAWFQRDATSA